MIIVENLAFRYPKSKEQTLKGLSFKVKEGEIFGFLGPSGAGKSTTQKILTGILKGYSGQVVVLKRNLAQWKRDYYNHIGVGFELPNHFLKLSAYENLSFFASLYERKTWDIDQLLKMVGLDKDKHMRIENFSKGMKMRLNFIRSILHQPEILFLDEPTSGLDPVNARLIKDMILEMKGQGKTILLSTHNMHDADELCDKVAFIVDGEIKQIDAPKILKSQQGKPMVTVEYRFNSHIERQVFELSSLGKDESFISLISKHTLSSIHSQEASLEDVFIAATGRQLQ